MSAVVGRVRRRFARYCGGPGADKRKFQPKQLQENVTKTLRTFAISLILFVAAATLASSQNWVPLVDQPNPNLGLGNPLLLTDGTVIAHEACGSTWRRLTPDAFGNYVSGTWKKIASLPTPLYFGSAAITVNVH